MIHKQEINTQNFTITCKSGTIRAGIQKETICVWYEVGDDLVHGEVVFTGKSPTLPNFVATLPHNGIVYHIYTDENFSEPLVGEQSSFQPEPVSEPPYNGIVFNYVKQNGTTRLVRLNHMQFMVVNGKQAVMGYDADRKAMRTFYLDQVINFPPCE